MTVLITKDIDWLKKWDDFVLNENHGSHLLLSDWIKSFIAYGFDYEICILVDNQKIVGGFAAVIAKAAFFKFYIVPFGPIISTKHQSSLDYLIEKVKKQAQFHFCCYAHISLPCSIQKNEYSYIQDSNLKSLINAKKGHLFNYVYSSYGINWKSVKDFETEEALIDSFSASVRRYIRSSQRKGLELQFLQKEEDIKNGYYLCIENAKKNGYSLRDWNTFKNTIISLVEKGHAKFMVAVFDNQIKGASFIIKAANHYTYILGGTVKEKPDFLAGHFLHYAAIKLAFDEKLTGYNISLGGSTGVINLKNSYADEQIYYNQGQYHWVINPFYFNLYLLLEKHLKSNKKTVSKLLSLLKR